MRYKKITNREAVELFLAGSCIYVKPPGYDIPVLVARTIEARDFSKDSKCEFYVSAEPKRSVFNAEVVLVDGLRLTKTLRIGPTELNDLPEGTKVRVTIEEVVE